MNDNQLAWLASRELCFKFGALLVIGTGASTHFILILENGLSQISASPSTTNYPPQGTW